MSTSITLTNLTKTFAGPKPAVDGVSLQIDAGELFFLLGPSGCGKTTLLRMIAGFIDPTSGAITFRTPQGARDVTHVAPNKRNTGMVFQSYALWPHMTVEANVAFGLTVRGESSAEKKRRVAEALDLVRMGEYASRKPNQLSGGQQQRVALARALVVRPDVLLLDEPLSNLDAKLRIELRSEIRRICKEARTASSDQGMTAIYVTHDQKEALSMADRIAIMREGRVEQVGGPRELYRNPTSAFVAEFLGETNFIPGRIAQTGERVRVSTPFGQFLARAPRPLPLGSSVRCSIRPEALRPAGTELINRLVGHVRETTYLGETAQVELRLRPAPGEAGWASADDRAAGISRDPGPETHVDGERVQHLKVSLMNPALTPAPGQELSFVVDPDDVVCVPDA